LESVYIGVPKKRTVFFFRDVFANYNNTRTTNISPSSNKLIQSILVQMHILTFWHGSPRRP
jgi:hypothetical protein